MKRRLGDLDSALENAQGTGLVYPKKKLIIPSDSELPTEDMDSFEIKTEGNFDLEKARNVKHDPSYLDWQYDPVGFKEFCESKEHMHLVPPDWKEGEEGALSWKQIEDCTAVLGDDPKKMFDPKVRKYVIGILLWSKGCLDGNTLIFDEATKKEYTIRDIVENNRTIYVRVYNEKTKKIERKKIARAFSKGIAKKLVFRLKSGKTVTVSPDHRFLTKKGWVRAGDLVLGNEIATSKKD